MKIIEIISTYNQKQEALLLALRASTERELDEYFLKGNVPESIFAIGEVWDVMPHGKGIRFSGTESRQIIDIHEGINEPDLFDAWRLSTYIGSIHAERHVIDSLELTLDKLREEGVIEIAESHYGHFRFVK